MFYKNLKDLLTLELGSLCRVSTDLAILIRDLETVDDFKSKFPVQEVRRLYTETKEPLFKALLLISIEYYLKGSYTVKDKSGEILSEFLNSEEPFDYVGLNHRYYINQRLNNTPTMEALTYKLYNDLYMNPVFEVFCKDLLTNHFEFFTVYPKYKYWLGQVSMLCLTEDNMKLFHILFTQSDAVMPCWANVAIKRMNETI